MPNFQYEPKKSKPDWLDPVCKRCEKYEVEEGEVSTFRKMLFGNPHFNVHFSRCKFDPQYASADNVNKCPYKNLFGKDIVEIFCDICGKNIRMIDPVSPEGDHRFTHRSDEGKGIIDVCSSCRQKGL